MAISFKKMYEIKYFTKPFSRKRGFNIINTEIRRKCITKTNVPPPICLLQTWFICQQIADDSGNRLTCEPGESGLYSGSYSRFCEACRPAMYVPKLLPNQILLIVSNLNIRTMTMTIDNSTVQK